MKNIKIQDGLVLEIQKNNDAVLKKLYQQNYHKTRGFVLKNNGSEIQAKDIYQEAFIAVWQNVKNGTFLPKNETALQGYLYQIAKNKWIDYLRSNQYKKTTQITADINVQTEVLSEDNKEFDQRLNLIETHFKRLGNECKELLKSFYYEKKSLREIAKIFDINEASARNKKYRCIQQLKTQINPK
ncbi:MAG: sigma-70 family RNA polymerase sigma factor [Flavobacteriaceae bacterium]